MTSKLNETFNLPDLATCVSSGGTIDIMWFLRDDTSNPWEDPRIQSDITNDLEDYDEEDYDEEDYDEESCSQEETQKLDLIYSHEENDREITTTHSEDFSIVTPSPATSVSNVNDEHTQSVQEVLHNSIPLTENYDDMSEIRSNAIDSYTKLLEMGMQAPPQQSGQYLEPSVQFLKIAMEADQNKLENRLKVERLLLEREKLKVTREKLSLASRQYSQQATLVESEEIIQANQSQILKMLREDQDN